jgi:class 3 adenylate cyclase/tetratricopeptide (TPR) repeat protein
MLSSMVERSCERCGHALPPDARFCPNCGAPVAVAVTAERKVVTVLFADLAGSTAIAAALDPERFREVMAAFYRTVSDELASLRGRAEKFVGDAVMAVFGLPQIHEDDALRAVRAGLIIRDRTVELGQELGLSTPMRVRVGIDTGPVATGSGPADQLLVTGATVNLAARLQQAAQPGEILVGDTTRQLTRLAVEFAGSRTVAARGFGDEIPAWPVVRLSPRSSRRTIPMVGRKRELSLLTGTFDRVRETSRAHLVTILGERGVGKRRLVNEFIAGLPEGAAVLAGRASGFEDDLTVAPLADLLRRELGVGQETPAPEVSKRLEEAVSGCCNASESERVAARLGLALGLADPGTREARRYRWAEIRAGFLTYLEGKARHGPVVLVFEELHLAQQGLFDLIEHVFTQGRRRLPILVLCLARDELMDVRPGWGGGIPDALTLRLEPLTKEEAKELAKRAGDDLDDTTAERIAQHAGGNPFFIVETTGMLMQRHREHVEGVAHSHLLPPTVQSVVASRIDHLGARPKELVRRASVFPRSTFHVEELRLIAEPAEEDLRALEEAELLLPDPRREGVWRFRHGLLRDVAYESLPKRERQRLHLLVADALAAGDADRHLQDLAYHLEEGARAALDLDPLDRSLADRAIGALAEAGHQARRRIQSRAAIDLYQRALDLAGPEERWGLREARILSGIGEARYWTGEYGEATAWMRRALEVGGEDAWTVTHAARFLADIALNVDGDPKQAGELFDRAIVAARELDDPWAMARTLLVAGWAPYWRGALDEARAMFEEALSIARDNPEVDRWAEARALTSLASVISPVGDEAECLALAKQAEALGREMADPFTLAVAGSYIGNSLRRMWRLEDALPALQEAVRNFRELDARWELASALGDRGSVHRLSGRLDEAESDTREALEICRDLRERGLVAWTAAELSRILLARGDLDAAEGVIGDPSVRVVLVDSEETVLVTADALLAMARGDGDRAVELATKAVEAERASGWPNPQAARVWWAGTLFGADVAGGPQAMDDARATLESAHWIQSLREPELLREMIPFAVTGSETR